MEPGGLLSRTPLGQYVDHMRKRQAGLTMDQMSLEAGLPPDTVRSIIQEGHQPALGTLQALSDRWGTAEDYRNLLQLLGDRP